MDIVKSETFKIFRILNKALLFLIELNKTAVQSVPKIMKSVFWVTVMVINTNYSFCYVFVVGLHENNG